MINKIRKSIFGFRKIVLWFYNVSKKLEEHKKSVKYREYGDEKQRKITIFHLCIISVQT